MELRRIPLHDTHTRDWISLREELSLEGDQDAREDEESGGKGAEGVTFEMRRRRSDSAVGEKIRETEGVGEE
jgi:hypothetical protein